LHLWAKSCNIVVYAQNMSPHQILGTSTLEETFSSKKLDMEHTRIFGSSIYCDVGKDARKKIEPIGELGIFVGYIDTPHNYQVYLPSHRMIVVSRDVTFNEEKAMICSLDMVLWLHGDGERLVPMEECQDDVEKPHV